MEPKASISRSNSFSTEDSNNTSTSEDEDIHSSSPGEIDADPIDMSLVQLCLDEPQYDSDEIPSDQDDDLPPPNQDQEQGEDVAETRIGNINWCACGQCMPMPTLDESRCCTETSAFAGRIQPGQTCLSTSERYRAVCLDEDVLLISLFHIHDVLNKGPLPNPPPNE